MMDSDGVRQAAEFLWSSWQERRVVDAVPAACRPGDLEAGYAVQAALADLAASPLLGWKIAATSRAGQAHIGVTEPLAGRLFQRFAHGVGAAVLDDPRLALTWLANDRAKRGEGLKAGQVVTTGTCIVPAKIAPGDSVVADFGELGRVGVRFVE